MIDDLQTVLTNASSRFGASGVLSRFTNQPFNFIGHTQASNAVERVIEVKPDFLIVDRKLDRDQIVHSKEKYDGWIIAHEIRTERPEFNDMPIMILTAWENSEDAAQNTEHEKARGIFHRSKDDALRFLPKIVDDIAETWKALR